MLATAICLASSLLSELRLESLYYLSISSHDDGKRKEKVAILLDDIVINMLLHGPNNNA